MQKNLEIKVKTLVEKAEGAGFTVSKDQLIALVFMDNKKLLEVEREIKKQTHRTIKATFTQGLINQLFVLDQRAREKIDGMSPEQVQGALEGYQRTTSDEIKTKLPLMEQSLITKKKAKPYRRDNKDLEENKLRGKPTPPQNNPLANTKLDSRNEALPQIAYIERTLTDEQIEEMVRHGSLSGIQAVLKNETTILTESQQEKLRLRLKTLSMFPNRVNKTGTIKIIEAKQKVRLNQASFRNAVLSGYEGKCAITDLNILPILEAAHVIPADGANDHIGNALLLSKNMHGLFD